MSIFNYITIVTAVLLSLLILIQTRGASLGAGLGGTSGEINVVRRGTDQTLHQLTIILAVIFTLSLLFGIIT
ncbi:MAG TPA: preprotein translocase subunit SecG [Candidatus Saccharimonadales bacterium]|nr:preprotein translocase subunit SecG [Candidatus Saccharimonadales bacterium]